MSANNHRGQEVKIFHKQAGYMRAMIFFSHYDQISCKRSGFIYVVGSKYERAIYAFEFVDNSVYIGLTYNYEKRLSEHLSHKKTVGLKAQSIKFEYIKFNRWYSPEEAVLAEETTLQDYIAKDWNILNKNKTGGLGAQERKWTKESCHEAAITCTSVSEFKEKFPSAYIVAHRRNYWPEISSHLTKKIEHGRWTKEAVHEVAKLCSSRSEFEKKSVSAYVKARKKKWLDDVCSHMTILVNPANYWTKERVQVEANKYQYKSDFANNSKAASMKARREGWFDDICSHMVPKRVIKWPYEKCAVEALKYSKRIDFKNNSTGAYQKASSNGWLQAICTHMPKQKNQYG